MPDINNINTQEEPMYDFINTDENFDPIIAGQDEEALRTAVAVVEELANSDIPAIVDVVADPLALSATLKAIATTLELFRVAVIQ